MIEAHFENSIRFPGCISESPGLCEIPAWRFFHQYVLSGSECGSGYLDRIPIRRRDDHHIYRAIVNNSLPMIARFAAVRSGKALPSLGIYIRHKGKLGTGMSRRLLCSAGPDKPAANETDT
jgi:hypothetical protein